MTERNKPLRESKQTEDINELILKVIDAPSKKVSVIVEKEL